MKPFETPGPTSVYNRADMCAILRINPTRLKRLLAAGVIIPATTMRAETDSTATHITRLWDRWSRAEVAAWMSHGMPTAADWVTLKRTLRAEMIDKGLPPPIGPTPRPIGEVRDEPEAGKLLDDYIERLAGEVEMAALAMTEKWFKGFLKTQYLIPPLHPPDDDGPDCIGVIRNSWMEKRNGKENDGTTEDAKETRATSAEGELAKGVRFERDNPGGDCSNTGGG